MAAKDIQQVEQRLNLLEDMVNDLESSIESMSDLLETLATESFYSSNTARVPMNLHKQSRALRQQRKQERGKPQ
jgi:hypothetical protein